MDHSLSSRGASWRVLLSTVLVGLLSACSGGSSSSAPPANQDNGWRVFTDAQDGRLAARTMPDGSRVLFSGRRGEEGRPEALTHVQVDQQGGPLLFALDASGFPAQTFAASGAQMRWEQVGPRLYALSAIDPTGSVELRTELDLDNPPSQPQVRLSAPNIRRGAQVALEFTAAVQHEGAAQQRGAAQGSVTVDVTECGQPTDQRTVFVRVEDLSNGAFVGTFPAASIGGGRYAAQIPSGQFSVPITADVCATLESMLGTACTALDLGGPAFPLLACTALAAAASSSGIGSLAAAPILDMCLASSAAIELYCLSLGASPAPGAPSLAQMLCDAIPADPSPSQLRLQAFYAALPSNVYGPAVEVAANGALPTLRIDDSSLPVIVSLDLNPSAPGQGQSYVATANIGCLPAGSVVTMSIVGTDGYTDSRTYNVSEGQPSGSFTLNVPGAASGVRDTVTVRVALPGGGSMQRESFLVFG